MLERWDIMLERLDITLEQRWKGEIQCWLKGHNGRTQYPQGRVQKTKQKALPLSARNWLPPKATYKFGKRILTNPNSTVIFNTSQQ